MPWVRLGTSALLAACGLPLALAVPVGGVACPADDAARPCTGPRSPRELLEQIAAPARYDRTLRPPCGNGTRLGPTLVEVQLHLAQLNQVDHRLGHIELNGYFRTWWRDPRLAFAGPGAGGCVDSINMNAAESIAVWQPDLYIDNIVEARRGATDGIMTRVFTNGSVWRSEQVLLKVQTETVLGRLPYDTQVGRVTVGSYSLDLSQLRITARHGSFGPGRSGVGITTLPMTSTLWEFPEGAAESGFQTQGRVEQKHGWEFVHLEWSYTRKSKYYEDQVIIPSQLFLLVSYIQFFVDSRAAPARAALAVIPVLIMRTMSNSVYHHLPSGSQKMWLADFLNVCTAISVLAALEFGLVQYLRIGELSRAEKLKGLMKERATAESLCRQAREERITLSHLLERYGPVVVEEAEGTASSTAHATPVETPLPVWRISRVEGPSAAPVPAEGAPSAPGDRPELKPEERWWAVEVDASSEVPASLGDVGVAADDASGLGREGSAAAEAAGSHRGVRAKGTSPEASAHNVKEADLLFIRYAAEVFKRHDLDGSNSMSAHELRSCLTFFNIYLDTQHCAESMAIFLRDLGFPTPEDETLVTFHMSQFTEFLLKVDGFMLTPCRRSCSIRSLVAWCQAIPPSRRMDRISKFVYPVVLLGNLATFYFLLFTGAYERLELV